MIDCIALFFNCAHTFEVKIEKYIFIAMFFNYAPTFEVRLKNYASI
jgi:hypothetical protein